MPCDAYPPFFLSVSDITVSSRDLLISICPTWRIQHNSLSWATYEQPWRRMWTIHRIFSTWTAIKSTPPNGTKSCSPTELSLVWAEKIIAGLIPAVKAQCHIRLGYRRFHNTDDSKDRSVYQWPKGDVGYIKGIAVAANGDQDHTHLSLSNSAPPRLLWYESDDSYGFYARQTTGNRIVLYGRTSNGHRSGLRVVVPKIMIAGASMDIKVGKSFAHWPLGLDCAFVPVGNRDWAAEGAGNF